MRKVFKLTVIGLGMLIVAYVAYLIKFDFTSFAFVNCTIAMLVLILFMLYVLAEKKTKNVK